MPRHFFSLACFLILYCVVLHVNVQANNLAEVTISNGDSMAEKEAIVEIERKIKLGKYRNTPTIAIAKILARATRYVHGVKECLLLGEGTHFRTPAEVLRCVRQYIESSKGPCAIRI